MSNPTDVRAAFARVVALTWRLVWLNLLLIAVAGVGVALALYRRSFRPADSPSGLLIAFAGFQLWIASGQFARLGSDRSYYWLRPLSVVCVVAGALLVILAFTGIYRVAAP